MTLPAQREDATLAESSQPAGYREAVRLGGQLEAAARRRRQQRAARPERAHQQADRVAG